MRTIIQQKLALRHYLNQFCMIDNWNKLQWILSQNCTMSIQESLFQELVCNMLIYTVDRDGCARSF